jgi:hypothetical protein
MKKSVSMLILIMVSPIVIFAQKQPPRFDKPGTFTILSRTNYTLPECGFTKAEMTANLQKITELINTIHKTNLVLSNIVGFEGRARIYNTMNCTEYGGYGVPSRISFEFCTWYLNNSGKEELGTIEPPEWSIFINKILPNSPQFSASGTSDRFSIPAKKETIERGLDVYGGECYVIYNPDRPPYWLPLTVKEAYEAWIDVWENDKGDKTTSSAMLDIIKKKYAAIPESDLNKPAYDGGPWPTAENNPDAEFSPIMHVNPEYWDKSLPKSAIQFIYFRSVPNKDYYRRLKEEHKIFDSTYHLFHFEETFDMDDIRTLIPLIEK